MARLVLGGEQLREQINRRWPNRDKASDGWIGDAAHAARPSDHNPDSDGWVHALDIDADLDNNDPLAAERLALSILRAAKNGDKRVKNVVFRGRVASATVPGQEWVWRSRPELGHPHHIHVSFSAAAKTDGSPWAITNGKLTPTVVLADLVVGRSSSSAALVITGMRRRGPWWKTYLAANASTTWTGRTEAALTRYGKKNGMTLKQAVQEIAGTGVRVI